jgi:asparagine synthase (glutamine-hydrolysing)
MCGSAGDSLKQAPADVERMINKLTHRGPDGQGLEKLPNGTLGHTRLAILDVEGGLQPMGFDGAWLTFNGEVYNYREWAHEHLSDEPLRTHSDIEVVIP